MTTLLLIGCGGHARSIIDIAESTGKWSSIALVGLKEEVGSTVLGYSVIGTDSNLIELREEFDYAFLALGQISFNHIRIKLAKMIEDLNYNFPTLISPNAIVSKHAKISYGTSIGHGAVINAGVEIGRNCIINSKALIEHDVCIDDFCHISTGCLINGSVTIGSNTFIGSGSIVRDGVKIPQNSLISCGSRVMGWPMKDLKL